MRLILFLIIILGAGGGGFFLVSNYEKRISSLHMENMLLKKQLSKLQNKYKELDNSKTEYTIQFLNFENHYGIIPSGSILYLSPYVDSCILQKTSIAMEVGILEKALVDNTIWYYVTLPIESDINCRGWIRESSFSNVSCSNTDIIPK